MKLPPRRGRASPLRIRRATIADASAVARVMRAAVRAERRGPYTQRQLAAWSALPALYHLWAMTTGGETYLVAERGGRLVGYAALRDREVTAAFVLPAARGAGVGRALVARVEALARGRGATSLEVKAAAGAVAFYEACGYAGRRRITVPLPGGARLPASRLAKPLGRA